MRWLKLLYIFFICQIYGVAADETNNETEIVMESSVGSSVGSSASSEHVTEPITEPIIPVSDDEVLDDFGFFGRNLCRFVGLCPSFSEPKRLTLVCPNNNDTITIVSTFHSWNTKICCKFQNSGSGGGLKRLYHFLCPMSPFLLIAILLLGIGLTISFYILKCALWMLGIVAGIFAFLVLTMIIKAYFFA